MRRKNMRRKSIKRKLSNILLLIILLAIIFGISYNIYNSRAEEVIEISAIALDNYGYLESEEFTLEAKDVGNNLYEIEIPESINTKAILELVQITLQDVQGNIANNNTEPTEEEQNVENTETEEDVIEENGETDVATEENTEEQTETNTEEQQEQTEANTEEEQREVNIEEEPEVTENKNIEIIDNKIQLTKEELETKIINLEVKYDVTLLQKTEEGLYQKEPLTERVEISTEEVEMLYNKILKWEDEENEKLVEVRGFLPVNAELKVEEVTQEQLTETFGESQIDVAYDIKIMVPVQKEIIVQEDNLETEEDETITEIITEYIEIHPEDFEETCEVTIQDTKISEESDAYHVNEDNTIEKSEVTENTDESISFESGNFTDFDAISSDTSIIVGAGAGVDEDTTAPEIIIGEVPITAERLTIEDYGGYVTNYESVNETANGANIDWRIFHSDGENIYLIADDYIETTYVPKGKNGTSVNASGDYRFHFADIVAGTDYNGTSDISNTLKTKLLSQYASYTSTTPNAKVTAYLLDTNQWANFKDNSGHAEYAIGGPTLELFENSYNSKYPGGITETQVMQNTSDSSYGYTTPMFNNFQNNGLYIMNSIKAPGYWIASPSASSQNEMCAMANMAGSIPQAYNSIYFGARPIVSLKSDVQLRKQADGTYTIIDTKIESGNQTWSKSHTETITIADFESGLAIGTQIQYGWSESNTIQPSAWTTRTISGYVAGDKTASIEVTKSGLTGKYYLWVKSTNLKDIKGNSQTTTTISDKQYYFDNTAPEITIGEAPITAQTLTTDDYGGYVTNYVASNGSNTDLGIGGWRIFHSDGENIYLIADDYVNRTYVPKGKGDTLVGTGSTYPRGFTLAPYTNYTGTADIDSNIASKLLSQYTSAGYTAISKYANGRATAYLLDTNQWSGFKDSSGYAEYAIGAPTLELYTSSYNATHPEKTIDTQVSSQTGYKVKWSTDSSYSNSISGLDTSEKLYVITDNTNASGMWVASPSAQAVNYPLCIRYDKYIYYYMYSSSAQGSRPIVVLNSDVKLIKEAEEQYRIITEDEIETKGGNTTWSQSHTETITIADFESGLAEGAQIQYGWSESNTVQPTTWTTVDVTGYTAGDKTASIEVTQSGIAGQYYLWAKTVNVKDTSASGGNSQTTTIKSDAPYYFDNTGPEIIIDGITASNITAEDYGGYVTNYVATGTNTNLGIGGWKIFHSDGENIYLIADNYISRNFVPLGKGYTWINYGPGRGFALMPYNDYAGLAEVNYNIATKLLSQYTTAGYNPTTGSAGKATAYLLDTNAWSGFANSNYADYAIGAPTLELFAQSYNVTHPEKTIDTQATSQAGYKLKWSTDSSYTDWIHLSTTNESLYVITDNTNAEGMWIATPNASNENDMMGMYYQGVLGNQLYTSETYGVRPVVVLKSDIHLQKQQNGTYLIVEDNYPTTWSKSHTETITIRDQESGLAEGAQVQYGWSETADTEPTTWTTVTVPNYSAGDKTAKVTITKEQLNGKYFLWVKPVALSDIGGNSQTATTKSEDQYYFDNTAPEITIETENNTTTWSKSHAQTITITDTHSGLAEAARLQYAWSTSNTVEPGASSWTEVTVTGYTAGAQTASLEITQNDITGKYYLWVKPVNVKDISVEGGNAQTQNQTSTNQYWFDNTLPTVTATQNNNNITITMADEGSGLESNQGNYYISTSSTTLAEGEWKQYTSGTAEPIHNLTGEYYLFIERVNDNAENISEQYGTLTTINSIKYHRFGPYTFDSAAPTLEITADRESPTNAEYILYTFTFSEPVTDFTIEDISIWDGLRNRRKF